LPLVSNVYNLESERSPASSGGLVVAIKRLEGEALRHSQLIYLEREEARQGIENDYHVAQKPLEFQVNLEKPYEQLAIQKKNG
ncbi:MAG: DUF1957 domain-containing protein, partial [Exiguobacterium oxidotolerans]